MKKLASINLNKASLYGWEKTKIDADIDFLVKKIEKGINFPPVPVFKINNHEYELVSTKKRFLEKVNGGHKRAIAYYISNKNLKCIIKGYREKRTKKVNIKDIILEDSELLINGKLIKRSQLEYYFP